MAYLEIRNLTKRFGEVLALDDVTLAVEAGEFVSLLGGSGCGKTTLLRAVAGFVRQDAGAITIAGRPVDTLAPSKRDIGFVFQSYALFPTKTVRQNIGFALKLRGVSRREREARVQKLCAAVKLDGLADRFPHEISGGQQQRVALARAIASEPALLLLDEPLSALDAKIRAHLRLEIRSLVERLGVTTLYVTHDQEEALAISDRIAVMDQGRILQAGAPMALYNRPESRFVAEFIGETNLLDIERLGGRTARIVDSPLTVSLPEKLSGNGRRYVASIRPEHITAEGHDDHRLGQGRVLAVTFLGPVTRVEVGLGGERRLLVQFPSAKLPAEGLPRGARLTLFADPAQVTVVPDKDQA